MIHRLRTLAVLVIAGFALTASACGTADAFDINSFVTAANGFIGANNELQQSVKPEDDAVTLHAKIQPKVDTMRQELAKMTALVAKLDGENRKAGNASLKAAQTVLSSSEAMLAGLEAQDPTAVDKAATDNNAAIVEFNKAAKAFNEQVGVSK